MLGIFYLQGSVGDLLPAGKCWGSSTCREVLGIFYLQGSVGDLLPAGKCWGSSFAKVRAKGIVLMSILSLGDGAYSRKLKTEKSLSRPFPVGGGAVVTNDWYIILKAISLL